MSPRLEREAAQDDVSAWSASPEYAERFGRLHIPDTRPPVDALPMHLANAVVPRRNIVAEYDALPVEGLIDEANELTARMLSATCNPRDYAIVVALVRRLKKAPAKLDGMLMLDFGSAR